MKITILDDWYDTLQHLPCFEKLDGHDVTIWNDHVEDVDQLADRLKDAEAVCLFRERTPLRKELLERLPNLRIISQRSVYPHIDVEDCTRLGILLSSGQHPDAPSSATVELTWTLILAAMRELPREIASMKAGNWQGGVGRSVKGKTLGIYGFGRIGSAVADIAKSFNMNIIAWGTENSRTKAREAGIRVPDSREAFFGEADIVSLHVRLYPSTRGCITAKDLAGMKPRALLVNTSRAGLIEPGALQASLEAGRPGYAAIDVHENEPVHDPNYPLLKMPNVLCTPHIGYVTEDEYQVQFTEIFDQVLAFERGEPINMINPEALKVGR